LALNKLCVSLDAKMEAKKEKKANYSSSGAIKYTFFT
jgi:hypothetical protein